MESRFEPLRHWLRLAIGVVAFWMGIGFVNASVELVAAGPAQT